MPATIQHYGSIHNPMGAMDVPLHPIPSYPLPQHVDYRQFYPLWITAKDFNEGEYAVKGKREIYLPRLNNQTPAEYAAYLKRATFFNGIALTVTGLMGSLFRESPELNIYPVSRSASANSSTAQPEPVALTDQELETLKPKFDKSHISKDHLSYMNFFKQVAKEILLTSRCGVLVDLPTIPSSTPEPFCVFYCPENIINWRWRDTGKSLILDQVILVESKQQTEAFGISDQLLFRVLQLDANGHYEQLLITPSPATPNILEAATQQRIVPLLKGEPLDFIPFQFFGSSINTPQINTMVLKDIMSLNNSHYRSYAEVEHGRFFCGMPTYWVKGAGLSKGVGMPGPASADSVGQSNSTPFVVGPNNIWLLDTEDDVGILEFKGSGLTYLESALEQKQAQMAAMGSKLLVQNRRAAGIPTTMLELAQLGEQATLLDIANNLDEGLSTVINWMLKFASLDDTYVAKVSMNKDFEPSEITAREMRAIESLYDRGLLPIPIIYDVFRSSGILKSSITLAEFTVLVEQRLEERKKEQEEAAALQAETALASRPPNAGGGTRGSA